MPRPAIHPGEILADELEDIGVTPTALSRQIPGRHRITQITGSGVTQPLRRVMGLLMCSSQSIWC